MKIVSLTQQQQTQVKVLQDHFKQAQQAHMNSYKALLAHLHSITGVSPDKTKRVKLAVSDDGQHIVIV